MQKAGVECKHVIRDGDLQTAIAVLPVYGNGKRDCFANLGANLEFSLMDAKGVLRSIGQERGETPLAAVHFGYPHFLPKLQGSELKTLLDYARRALGHPLISLVTTTQFKCAFVNVIQSIVCHVSSPFGFVEYVSFHCARLSFLCSSLSLSQKHVFFVQL